MREEQELMSDAAETKAETGTPTRHIAPPATAGIRADLAIEDRGGVRIIALSRGKANVIDAGFAALLHEAVKDAQREPGVRAVVLTSTSPKIFCGGFDLAALSKIGEDEFRSFIKRFEPLFFDLFLLGKPVVAALTGHAIAGGALLAATADFRLAAAGPGTLGLSEIKLGVQVPRFALEVARTTLGERLLSRLALTGDSLSFQEALEAGALDRIVAPDRLLEEAIGLAERLSLSPMAYAAIKRDLRSGPAARAQTGLEEGRSAFVSSWFSEAGQAGIAAALARLAAR
jgi:enoyl-CoA hydratase